MTDAPVLVCRGVDVAYDKVQVLFGVDLEVGRNEIVALLGTNGAGKSTLLKAISGLVDPKAGEIWFDGADITHDDAVVDVEAGHHPGARRQGRVPDADGRGTLQGQHVALPEGRPERSPGPHRQGARTVPARERALGADAGNLSGGEQQQLALGMAFVAKPKLLIIDELSLGLAPTIVEQLLGIVRQIHEQGCTIILVEQSVNVALTIANRAYFMEKGEVRFSGPTQELLERGDILRSVFLQGPLR